MRKILLFATMLLPVLLHAQTQASSLQLPQGHPRYLVQPEGKTETLKLINDETWAKEVLTALEQRIAPISS